MSPSSERATFLVDRHQEVVRSQKWWSPFAVVGRRLDALVGDFVAGAELGADATVVDLGCADQPYRALFEKCDYIGVDLPGNPDATVELEPDGRVPLPDSSADLVLSSQVLEHVTDPAMYLAESYRLLRPGATLVLTTHGLMYLHRDPTDLWRWTCDGLRVAVERAGFEVKEQRGVLTLTAAGLQLVQAGLGNRIPRGLRTPVTAVFQGLIALADRFGTEEGRRENGLVLGVRAVRV